MRRRKRKALFDTTSQVSGADALHGMSWQEFEMLVGEGFKRRGYGVRETGGGGADGGVDLVLTKGGEKFFVQCKLWKAFKVGVATVRELYGVMAAEGVAGGFLVTSGRFTGDARTFAEGRNIQLLDGLALTQLLREGRSAQAAKSPTGKPGVPHPAAADLQQAQATSHKRLRASMESATEPTCPRCSKPMVRRVAKKGAAAGKDFWGCPAYSTGCRGTREIEWPQSLGD